MVDQSIYGFRPDFLTICTAIGYAVLIPGLARCNALVYDPQHRMALMSQQV